MGSTVQARLDAETQEKLQRLVERHGLTTSEVIREGLRVLEERFAEQERSGPSHPKLIGAGTFDSAKAKATARKKPMEGFGKKWRVDESGKGRWDW